ncbi:MAG: hypothetical protein IPK39_05865 [Sulfuritalea sp.]|nr:hypothetical protein [Sulfuritalea sp.]
MLAVGERGRGAFTLDEASRHLTAESVLTINGDASDNVITIARDAKNPAFFGVVIDGAIIGVYQASTLDRIVVKGLAGNDTLEVDGRIRVAGGISFDGGTGNNNHLIVLGEDLASTRDAEVIAGAGTVNLVVTKPMAVVFVGTQKVFKSVSANNLAKFQQGLQTLAFDRALSQAVGTKQVPLVGNGLGKVITAVSTADAPIGFPDSLRAPVELRGIPEGTAATQGDSDSILGRLLQGGPAGFLISQFDAASGDFESLRALLDGLDFTPGNVTLTETGGFATYDVRVERTFGGDTSLDIAAFDGMLKVTGTATFSVDALLHVVIGVDEHGFFLDADAVTGPELVLDNISIVGDITATGRIGFLEVSLTAGSIELDPDVRVAIDLKEPGRDPITGELDTLIRPYELAAFNPLDFFTVDLAGDPTADDLKFSGDFSVAALIHGGTGAFTIVDAGLIFTWADIGNPFTLSVAGKPGDFEGELLAKFLNLDFQQLFLDLLVQMDNLGDQLRDVAVLDSNLPVIDTSVNRLFTGEPYKIGDLLKMHDPVAAYFAALDAEDQFPTMSGLLDVIVGEVQKKMDGSALGLELVIENGKPLLRINVDVDLEPILEVPLDLGDSLADLGVNATAAATVVVGADLDLDLVFGLDLSELVATGALGDAAFIQLNHLTAQVFIGAEEIDLDLGFDFLTASIDNAAVRVIAGAELLLNDPTPADQRITLTDLTGTPFGTLVTIQPTDPELRIAAESIDIFVGANAGTPEQVGMHVTGEDLGFILYGDFGPTAADPMTWTYALTASGAAELVGVSGLTVKGGVAVRVNTTGRQISESIVTGGEDVIVSFGAGQENYARLEGSNLQLGIEDFIFASGSIVLERFDMPGAVDVLGPNGAAGADGIKDVTDTDLRIGVGLTEVFIGAGRGTADETGLKFTDGSLGVVVLSRVDQAKTVQDPSRFAVKGSLGAALLVGVDDIQFSANNLAVEVNRSGSDLAGIAVARGDGTSIDMQFNSAANVTLASGGVTLQVLEFVYLKAFVSVEKTDTPSGLDLIGPNNAGPPDGIDDRVESEIRFGATVETAFVGTGRGTTDEMGLKLADGTLGLIVFTATDQSLAVQDAAKFAVKGTLSLASLVGVDGLTLSSTDMAVEVNRTGKTLSGVVVSTGPPGAPQVDMSFASMADVTRASGAVTVQLQDILDLQATVSIEKTDVLSGSDLIGPNNAAGPDGIDDRIETELRFGATVKDIPLTGSLGTAGEVGLRLSGGKLGLIAFSTTDQRLNTQAPAKYAVKGSIDTASLLGMDGLTLFASNLTVEVNRSGKTLAGVRSQPGRERQWSPWISAASRM